MSSKEKYKFIDYANNRYILDHTTGVYTSWDGKTLPKSANYLADSIEASNNKKQEDNDDVYGWRLHSNSRYRMYEKEVDNLIHGLKIISETVIWLIKDNEVESPERCGAITSGRKLLYKSFKGRIQKMNKLIDKAPTKIRLENDKTNLKHQYLEILDELDKIDEFKDIV